MIRLVFGLTVVALALAEETPQGTSTGSGKCCSKRIATELRKNEVVPDVISKPFEELMTVNYNGTYVCLGNELTPTQVKQKPEISWRADKDSFYTVCMVDPDAPSRKLPLLREFRHWLVGNIPGKDVDQGTVLTDYMGAAPPLGSGLHRYVLLVFRQLEKQTFDEKTLLARPKFSIAEFAKNNHLGDPVAGNFYQAQWDITSDVIHKTLERPTQDMEEVLKKNGVIPDVLDRAWKEAMPVSYPATKVKVDLGNELTPTQVKLTPEVSWSADEGGYYTLCMADPDAPSRTNPLYREILHWLVVNVPGNAVEQGTTLAGYRGSGAPKGTGLHRYIFIVYKQPGKLDFTEKPIPSDVREGRMNFTVAKFAKKYNLGDPVAGNFFQAQWDSSVIPPPTST